VVEVRPPVRRAVAIGLAEAVGAITTRSGAGRRALIRRPGLIRRALTDPASPAWSPLEGYSPITAQSSPIMMKKPANIEISASAP